MDSISKQTELLVSNKLETYEQFFSFKTQKEKELDNLLDQRSKLWYKHKKSKNPSEKQMIRNQIDELSISIKELRKEVVLCDGIEERSSKIEQNVKEFEEEQRKEEIKMNTSGDAAESVVRMSLQGTEVALKLTGSAAKNIAALLYAIYKDKSKQKVKQHLQIC